MFQVTTKEEFSTPLLYFPTIEIVPKREIINSAKSVTKVRRQWCKLCDKLYSGLTAHTRLKHPEIWQLRKIEMHTASSDTRESSFGDLLPTTEILLSSECNVPVVSYRVNPNFATRPRPLVPTAAPQGSFKVSMGQTPATQSPVTYLASASLYSIAPCPRLHKPMARHDDAL